MIRALALTLFLFAATAAQALEANRLGWWLDDHTKRLTQEGDARLEYARVKCRAKTGQVRNSPVVMPGWWSCMKAQNFTFVPATAQELAEMQAEDDRRYWLGLGGAFADGWVAGSPRRCTSTRNYSGTVHTTCW